MQTFGLSLKLDCSAVIPAHFLAEARTEAQKPDAPLFLKTIQAKFPDDDDQFMLAVVKNAFRTTLRSGLLNFMQGSGVGGSVSPVQIVDERITQPKAAVAGFAEQTADAGPVPDKETKAVQLPAGVLLDQDSHAASYGKATQTLIESRKE